MSHNYPAVGKLGEHPQVIPPLRGIDGAWDRPMSASDPINPSHYKGDIECIDYQKSISTPEEFRGYLRLQAVKYIHRLNSKDTPTTNIDKALWYLNRLKKELET